MCANGNLTPNSKVIKIGTPILLLATMTVTMLMDYYLASIQGFARSTQITYRNFRNIVAEYPIAQMRICDVRISDAKNFIHQLIAAQKPNSTIRCIRSFLRRCFVFPYEDRIIPINPFDYRLDWLPRTGPAHFWLDKNQQASLLDYMSSEPCLKEYIPMTKVIMGSGVRLAEFCGLTVSDIDINGNCIRVNHQLYRGDDGMLHIYPPKTVSGYRTIPMLPGVADSLREAMEKRPHPEVEPNIDGYSGFIFLNKHGLPYSTGQVQYIFSKILKMYNQTHTPPLLKLSPHVLRHTFGATLTALCLPPVAIQQLMGHAHPSTATNIYSHMSYDTIVHVIQRVLRNDSESDI